MISSLRGTVLKARDGLVVLEVGGVGFSVQVTPEHALGLRAGAEARIETSLVVREDSLTLYGFEDAERLELFDLLTGVTGVGPKSALGVLARLSPDDVARAVVDEDASAFKKVSGIGPKTAKLILVSLNGKVRAPAARPPRAPVGGAPSDAVISDVVAALTGLGWSERTAADAARRAGEAASGVESGSVQALLRRALAELGPAGTGGGGA